MARFFKGRIRLFYISLVRSPKWKCLKGKSRGSAFISTVFYLSQVRMVSRSLCKTSGLIFCNQQLMPANRQWSSKLVVEPQCSWSRIHPMFVCLFSYPKPQRRYYRQPGGVPRAIRLQEICFMFRAVCEQCHVACWLRQTRLVKNNKKITKIT